MPSKRTPVGGQRNKGIYTQGNGFLYQLTESDGKRRWVSGPEPGVRFATAKDARDHREAARTAIRAGAYVPPTDETLEQFCARWLEYRATAGRKPLRPTTLASYADMLRDHVYPRLGSLPLTRITAAHLDKMYGELLTSGRLNGQGGLSPRTVRYIATIVGSALRTAYRWNLIAANPADKAEPPEPVRPEARSWSVDDLRAFLGATEGDRFGAVYHVAAMTGMRRGEVLGLRWSDIDLDAGTAKITQTFVLVDGRVEVSTPKTDAGRRVVSLDPGTVAVLRAHKRVQNRERFAAGPVWQDSGLVFTREDGRAISPDFFAKTFRKRVEGLDVPYISVHGLRHTHASALRSAGVDVKAAAARLGHADVRITMDTYQHLADGDDAAAAVAVASLVSG